MHFCPKITLGLIFSKAGTGLAGFHFSTVNQSRETDARCLQSGGRVDNDAAAVFRASGVHVRALLSPVRITCDSPSLTPYYDCVTENGTHYASADRGEK
ncbi:MAG: hypothetical protein P4M07_08595 [Xanthobacteraceae bacterium]|nr:hypothetical protein [Xanthobacteraceae bacterium]